MMSSGINDHEPNSEGRRQRRPRHHGFTLIELMIVVAIVAILAAIAYPSYQEQVRKSRRADAAGVLTQTAQWMERFYTQNNRYDQTTAGVAVALPTTESPIEGTPKAYDIQLQAVARNTFTLRAVPKGLQTGDPCGTLTLTETGVKGVTGGSRPVAQCW